jgi:hypothetical protein
VSGEGYVEGDRDPSTQVLLSPPSLVASPRGADHLPYLKPPAPRVCSRGSIYPRREGSSTNPSRRPSCPGPPGLARGGPGEAGHPAESTNPNITINAQAVAAGWAGLGGGPWGSPEAPNPNPVSKPFP